MFNPEEDLKHMQEQAKKCIKENDESMASAIFCDSEQMNDDFDTFARAYEQIMEDLEEKFGDNFARR